MISNITLNKSTNNNRLKCGNLHFQNNITISIINSNFNENTCKGNGGVMYVKENYILLKYIQKKNFNKLIFFLFYIVLLY